MNEMKNKAVIVTGASSGIGKASALKFAEEVAELIYFLASPRAGWITGVSCPIDRGTPSNLRPVID